MSFASTFFAPARRPEWLPRWLREDVCGLQWLSAKLSFSQSCFGIVRISELATARPSLLRGPRYYDCARRFLWRLLSERRAHADQSYCDPPVITPRAILDLAVQAVRIQEVPAGRTAHTQGCFDINCADLCTQNNDERLSEVHGVRFCATCKSVDCEIDSLFKAGP